MQFPNDGGQFPLIEAPGYNTLSNNLFRYVLPNPDPINHTLAITQGLSEFPKDTLKSKAMIAKEEDAAKKAAAAAVK